MANFLDATQDDVSFDIWFDHVTDELRARGYNGNIDRGSFELDYDNELMVGAAVEEFLQDQDY